MAFQYGQDDSAHYPMFVPATVFPDCSKSPGAAQPEGAVQGAPAIEGALGGFATQDHTKGGV